jgi:hypothetical protein
VGAVTSVSGPVWKGFAIWAGEAAASSELGSDVIRLVPRKDLWLQRVYWGSESGEQEERAWMDVGSGGRVRDAGPAR